MKRFLWTQTRNFGPSPRFAHSMAYDTARKQVVLAGGNFAGSIFDNPENPLLTWVWDGANWTQVSDSGPSSRANASMAYDSKRNQTVLFGGMQLFNGAMLGDTWGWDGKTWTQVASSGPTARKMAASTYDSHRARVLLHGGSGTGQPLADTWCWDGTQWTQIEASLADRFAHNIVYDSARDRVVLFGGISNGVTMQDTWEWDNKTWAQISDFGPPARSGACMAYDAIRKRVMLFGGYDSKENLLGDTWEWDGTFWTERQVIGPRPVAFAAMASDDTRGRLVLFGGLYSDLASGETWEGYERLDTETSAQPDHGKKKGSK
jgi:hypothetical protein